ncbi:MAG: hypothetical protein K2Y28_04110 [Burkholderiaceae bacterium]|nr:hypothetical protein [Burkholderiaceae bacterium]
MKYSYALKFGAALIGFASLVGCAKSPESVVESFYRALGAGEITEAKSYLSAEIFSLLGEKKLTAALASETEKIKACGGVASVVTKLQGEGEVRFGTTSVTFGGNCQPRNERTKLIQQDGKWKISANK